MEVKYTLCFIEQEGKYLMLNRRKSPNMGMWNGLGGKIEEGEDKFDSVKREIREESGLDIERVSYHGEVHWDTPDFKGGLYVFTAKIEKEIKVETPIVMDEGILHWQDKDWVLDDRNNGVVSNIPIFMKKILEKKKKLKFNFYYNNMGNIMEWKVEELKSR